MSYGHFWYNVKPTAELAEKARKIVGASEFKICGPEGLDTPIIEEGRIELNGSCRLGTDYMPFIIASDAPAMKAQTVTTGSGGRYRFGASGDAWGVRAYDEVVTAILLAAALDGNGEIHSDGQMIEWRRGVALYEQAVEFLSDRQYCGLRDALERFEGVSF